MTTAADFEEGSPIRRTAVDEFAYDPVLVRPNRPGGKLIAEEPWNLLWREPVREQRFGDQEFFIETPQLHTDPEQGIGWASGHLDYRGPVDERQWREIRFSPKDVRFYYADTGEDIDGIPEWGHFAPDGRMFIGAATSTFDHNDTEFAKNFDEELVSGKLRQIERALAEDQQRMLEEHNRFRKLFGLEPVDELPDFLLPPPTGLSDFEIEDPGGPDDDELQAWIDQQPAKFRTFYRDNPEVAREQYRVLQEAKGAIGLTTSEDPWQYRHPVFLPGRVNPVPESAARPKTDRRDIVEEHPILPMWESGQEPRKQTPVELWRGLSIDMNDPAAARIRAIVKGTDDPHPPGQPRPGQAQLYGHDPDIGYEDGPKHFIPPSFGFELGDELLDYITQYGADRGVNLGRHWTVSPDVAEEFSGAPYTVGGSKYLPVMVRADWDGLGEDPGRSDTEGDYEDEEEITLLPGAPLHLKDMQVWDYDKSTWRPVLREPQQRHAAASDFEDPFPLRLQASTPLLDDDDEVVAPRSGNAFGEAFQSLVDAGYFEGRDVGLGDSYDEDGTPHLDLYDWGDDDSDAPPVDAAAYAGGYYSPGAGDNDPDRAKYRQVIPNTRRYYYGPRDINPPSASPSRPIDMPVPPARARYVGADGEPMLPLGAANPLGDPNAGLGGWDEYREIFTKPTEPEFVEWLRTNHGVDPTDILALQYDVDFEDLKRQYLEGPGRDIVRNWPLEPEGVGLWRGGGTDLIHDPRLSEVMRALFGDEVEGWDAVAQDTLPMDFGDLKPKARPDAWEDPEIGDKLLDHITDLLNRARVRKRPIGEGGLGTHWTGSPGVAEGFGTMGPPGPGISFRMRQDWRGVGEDPYRSNTYGEYPDEQEITLLRGAPINLDRLEVWDPRVKTWRQLNFTPRERLAANAAFEEDNSDHPLASLWLALPPYWVEAQDKDIQRLWEDWMRHRLDPGVLDEWDKHMPDDDGQAAFLEYLEQQGIPAPDPDAVALRAKWLDGLISGGRDGELPPFVDPQVHTEGALRALGDWLRDEVTTKDLGEWLGSEDGMQRAERSFRDYLDRNDVALTPDEEPYRSGIGGGYTVDRYYRPGAGANDPDAESRPLLPDGVRRYYSPRGLNPPSDSSARPSAYPREVPYGEAGPGEQLLLPLDGDSAEDWPLEREPIDLWRGGYIRSSEQDLAEVWRSLFGDKPPGMYDSDEDALPVGAGPVRPLPGAWDDPDVGDRLLDYITRNLNRWDLEEGQPSVGEGGLGRHWSTDPNIAHNFAAPYSDGLSYRMRAKWRGLGEDPHRSESGGAHGGEQEITMLYGAPMDLDQLEVWDPRADQWRPLNFTPRERLAANARGLSPESYMHVRAEEPPIEGVPRGWERYYRAMSATPDGTGEADVWLPTDVVRRYREHDRDLDSEQSQVLRRVIQEHGGIRQPLTISTDGQRALLTEGNHRAAIAHELGIPQLPVKVYLDEVVHTNEAASTPVEMEDTLRRFVDQNRDGLRRFWGSRYRVGGSRRTAMPTYYHVTDDPDFELDPDYQPANNAFYGPDREKPGVFLTRNPWFWIDQYGYDRPYAAAIDVPEGIEDLDGVRPEERIMEQLYVPARHFDKLTLRRVGPRDFVLPQRRLSAADFEDGGL